MYSHKILEIGIQTTSPRQYCVQRALRTQEKCCEVKIEGNPSIRGSKGKERRGKAKETSRTFHTNKRSNQEYRKLVAQQQIQHR